ncbi:MAG: PAS domain S-box protein [Candidatus Bathyarchaeota archaeon]|nr:PAS domain S-box protein [Candidatus Bathyarchaeota archaeon]
MAVLNSDIADHKKAELPIADSGEDFKSYVEYSPVAVFVANLDGKFEYVNKAASHLIGYSREEILDLKIYQMVFEEDIPEAFKKLAEVKAKGQILDEFIFKSKDGQPVNIRVNGFRMPDGKLVAFCENVTERKKTEVALRMSEAKLRSIVENSTDQIFMIDENSRYLFVNKSLADSIGKRPEDIIGKSISEVYPPETAAQFKGNTKNVFATGKSLLVDEKMVVNNQELDISTVLNPVLDAQRNVIAVTGIVRDVTERKKIEKELHESEERFRIIFEGATDGILVADIKTQRFVLANPKMCQMAGYPLEDLLKLSVPDIHPKEFLSTVDGEFEKMATGAKVTAQDVPLLRSDKQILDCEVSSAILEIWNHQCLVGFFRDVTERKKAEKKLADSYLALEKQLHEINMLQKELENSNKLLGQSNVDLENYTYVVSHDLKAPLRAIRSFSTFILEDYKEKLDDTGKDYFQRIIDASTRMDALIENLLLLSRVGRKFMEVETVDLNQLLEEIVADLEPTLKQNNGTIVFHDLPKVTIPRTWMKQLFMNLIDNGLKFNKSKVPKVEVTCEDRDTEFLFKVSDNGIGIEEKYFDRLFTLFERLHTQEEYPGTGAGLAICKKIVQQFGGRIWVESQVGKGTTFFFTLLKNKNPPSGGN